MGIHDPEDELATRAILLVEDHPVVQTWLTRLLYRAFPGSRIMTADSVARAIEIVDDNDISIAIVDIHLVDGSGGDIIREVTHRNSMAECIAITIYDHDRHVLEAMKVDTLGYLFTDQPIGELAQQLRMIVDG